MERYAVDAEAAEEADPAAYLNLDDATYIDDDDDAVDADEKASEDGDGDGDGDGDAVDFGDVPPPPEDYYGAVGSARVTFTGHSGMCVCVCLGSVCENHK